MRDWCCSVDIARRYVVLRAKLPLTHAVLYFQSIFAAPCSVSDRRHISSIAVDRKAMRIHGRDAEIGLGAAVMKGETAPEWATHPE
jgi:hypothetical protein